MSYEVNANSDELSVDYFIFESLVFRFEFKTNLKNNWITF